MSTTPPAAAPDASTSQPPAIPQAVETTFDSRTLRSALGHFATGIAVVLAREGHALHGMTINSFTSVSLEPPLVLFCVTHGAHFLEVLKQQKQVGFSFLTAEQETHSRYFARQAGGEALGEPRTWGPDGLLLEGCGAGLVGTLEQTFEAGDHLIVLCRVTGVWHNPDSAAALLYYRGRYATGRG